MLKKILPYLTLFSSFGTLACCALPAFFVSLGLGATLVSVLGTFPQLIWLSEHKALVFGVAGAMILLSYIIGKLSSEKSCPIDPELAIACRKAKKLNKVVFIFTVVIYGIGVFFAFIAPIAFE
jgi:hypothetical protein